MKLTYRKGRRACDLTDLNASEVRLLAHALSYHEAAEWADARLQPEGSLAERTHRARALAAERLRRRLSDLADGQSCELTGGNDAATAWMRPGIDIP